MNTSPPEKVRFHFDPRCPWCFQGSRWIRTLERLGVIEVEWRLYCLEVSNLQPGQDVLELGTTARSATALRTAAAIGWEAGSAGVGRFYQALGERVWETSEPAQDRDLAVRESAVAAGFDAGLLDRAMADPESWAEVLRQHRHLVEDQGGLGVPTLVLDGEAGRAVFGPVISHLPTDEEALDIWQHVSWLARYDNFYEFKRHRHLQPDVPGWKVPVGRLTFGSRPWMPSLPADHVPTDGGTYPVAVGAPATSASPVGSAG